jgi:hypothetical protein
MKKLTSLIALAATAAFCFQPANAESHKTVTIFSQEANQKVISLLPVFKSKEKETSLSSEQPEVESVELDYSRGIDSKFAYDLGMNRFPVLDQGAYGTCVTFSSVASIGAIRNNIKINPQCSLALSLTLGNNYWYGAFTPSQIIEPMNKYGYILSPSCFGKRYPAPEQIISLSRYQSNSIKFNQRYDFFEGGDSLAYLTKKAIKKKKRVLIGFNLAAEGSRTGVGGFNIKIDGSVFLGGLWACKQPYSEDNNCVNPTGGHEVIVIGFDDSKRLFRIRNSWSGSYGYKGDWFMTYEYFDKMVDNITVINPN